MKKVWKIIIRIVVFIACKFSKEKKEEIIETKNVNTNNKKS